MPSESFRSMKIRTEHHHAIDLLIQHRFTSPAQRLTHAEIAQQCDITERTLRNWRNDADFQAALAEALDEFRRTLSAVRFAEKRARLEELERLYDATPDAYVSKVIKLKSPVADDRGQVLTDGEGQPATVIAVQRTNVLAKARILDQIADEVGDKVARKLHLYKDLENETDPRNLTTAELEMIARQGRL